MPFGGGLTVHWGYHFPTSQYYREESRPELFLALYQLSYTGMNCARGRDLNPTTSRLACDEILISLSRSMFRSKLIEKKIDKGLSGFAVSAIWTTSHRCWEDRIRTYITQIVVEVTLISLSQTCIREKNSLGVFHPIEVTKTSLL